MLEEFYCKICHNTGIRFIKEDDQEIAIPCKACKKQRIEKDLKKFMTNAGIPLSLQDYEFKDYIGKDEFNSIKALKNYVDKIDSLNFRYINLYVYGKKSSQKTTSVCVTAKELLRKGKKVRFVLAGDLIKLLMKDSSYGYDNEILEKIKRYKEVDFLIIDDIFDIEKSLYWEKSSNLVKTEWDIFLRYRMANGLRLIVTSNYPITVIKEKFGSSIQSLFKRNFKQLRFCDNIEEIAVKNIEKIFEDI